MGIAVLEHIAGAGGELAGKAVGVLASRGGVHIALTLAVLDGVVLGAAALDLDAGAVYRVSGRTNCILDSAHRYWV